MKKIIFGITNLNLGGAERVLVDICNKLCEKYDITIFTIYGNGDFEKELSPKVKKITMYQDSYEEQNKLNKYIIPLKIYFMKSIIYRKHINEKYDTEIAFLEGPITRIFSTKSKSRKIAWIHNDISLVFGNSLKAKIKIKLQKSLYRKYEELVFVSKDNLEKFNKVYSIPVKKQIIYNYLDIEKVRKKAGETIKEKWNKQYKNFLSVARLVEQKGIERLIEVHKQLIDNGYYHKFYIIGDGPLKLKLQEKIKNLNVEDTFLLLGKKENPYPYIKIADYFCLLSHFEGYGMVLEEAKILGKNIIITDTAAREAVVRLRKCKDCRKFRKWYL